MAETMPPAPAPPAPAARPVFVPPAKLPDAPPLESHSADNTPIDLSHPDLAFARGHNTNYYVWEFNNTETGTGPHIAITSCARGHDVVPFIRGMVSANPAIAPDWKKGFKAWPNVFLATADAEDRKKRLYLANPDRVGAEEMYAPGEANRILEEGKPA